MRRARRGFTLVELIAAMAISLLLISLTSVLFLSSFHSAGRTAQANERDQLTQEAYNLVERVLVDAKSISLEEGENTHSLSVADGSLYLGGAAVYDEGILSDSEFAITLTGNGRTMELSVALLSNGVRVGSCVGSFRLLNTAFSDRAEDEFILYFTPAPDPDA